MDSITLITFVREHLLAIVAVVVTLILIYHYVIERESGVKLSKRFRDSIYETQSKIFLNATQYLISGNKDLAIKEFLNAVDLNRETIDTYFALGGLFRSNGEIDKAISIHRSLIARKDINESTRLKALKELAVDFDKGGFLDMALETYKDVLKINRDESGVILSLCRIYEDLEDWDNAFYYRSLLSKVGFDNQSETISHILVESAKNFFNQGLWKECAEKLDEALRYSPSVSAKILSIRLAIVRGKLEESKGLLEEILREHPMYASFLFVAIEDYGPAENRDDYLEKLKVLKEYFLDLGDGELSKSPSVVLSQVRLLKSESKINEAYDVLNQWLQEDEKPSDILKSEFIKLLIDKGDLEKALAETKELLSTMDKTLTRHFCSHCGFNSDLVFWRCPQCHNWETIQFRWKV